MSYEPLQAYEDRADEFHGVTRFERFGFLRVFATGLLLWALVAAGQLLVFSVVMVTGLAVLYGWRLAGWELRNRLERWKALHSERRV